ncbi:transcriptional regulator [Putridiphycobacter roseus]|uniref:Transcriptional regulator n=1 Tax=Putridiphycobacter roseus TaxID=2219161 RepID=A0A2W1N2Q2_9FLAO|nr:DegT/DnrJ/EryC1/StrS family aminotransferase [Putridiphycobacter roseus]PZE18969.1 transcriptional regulator [Putridiphycobacter roseus]
MKKIQMVDLVSQYEKIKPEILKSIENVLDNATFINGPAVKSFQNNLEQYLNVKHVIPCANGTDALQIALMALGLEPGDEVITSDFTFAATVEVVKLLKLKPVLVDVDWNNFNISIAAIEKAITPKTKAIIPVHLFGQSADMESLMALAKKHNIALVEDTAQGIGAKYTFKNGETHFAGTIGEIGTTSFFPSKNLGGFGDGGAVFTNDDNLAKIMRSIVNHGMGERYYYDRVGVNSRLDSIQAAVLDIKLTHLDEYIASRQKAAAYYSDFFKDFENVETPVIEDYSTHVFHQYTLKIKGINQFEAQKYLNEKGIPAMIYYPVPLHSQKAYDADQYDDADFKNTNLLCHSVLSLPMHTELEEEQLRFICESLKKYLIK